MNNLEIKLIEGTFSPTEARKLLLTLINTKINYHNIELLSENVKFGIENINARSRVEYLKIANDQVVELAQKAITENLTFEIKGNITIVLK